MRREFVKQILLVFVAIFSLAATAFGVRIKDLASIRGMRNNQLIGFSIVIGLNGTGDSRDSFLARKPLQNALERMGVSISLEEIKGRSIAAVMVTATLPPFAKQGQELDVRVSALGNAVSLRGGVLIMTPLRAPNREVFAVAQGPIVGIPMGIELPEGRAAIGSEEYTFNAERNLIPTVGKVIGGAIVEREVGIDLNSRTRVFLNLHSPDFTTAFRMAKVVNRELGDGSARSVDAGTVEVSVPASYMGQTVELLSRIENMEIEPDAVAKVVLDERTGTIVMGTSVRILPIAISYGNLSIKIGFQHLQPDSEDRKSAESAPVQLEEDNNVILFKGGVDIKEVVDGLNKIGIANSDLIEVLKTIKSAGALQADLVIN